MAQLRGEVCCRAIGYLLDPVSRRPHGVTQDAGSRTILPASGGGLEGRQPVLGEGHPVSADRPAPADLIGRTGQPQLRNKVAGEPDDLLRRRKEFCFPCLSSASQQEWHGDGGDHGEGAQQPPKPRGGPARLSFGTGGGRRRCRCRRSRRGWRLGPGRLVRRRRRRRGRREGGASDLDGSPGGVSVDVGAADEGGASDLDGSPGGVGLGLVGRFSVAVGAGASRVMVGDTVAVRDRDPVGWVTEPSPPQDVASRATRPMRAAREANCIRALGMCRCLLVMPPSLAVLRTCATL